MIDSATTPATKLAKIDQKLSTLTWLAALLFSLRGLFEFYGMKQKGNFEQVLIFLTDPLVNAFQFASADDAFIPAVPALLAALFAVIFAYTTRIALKVWIRKHPTLQINFPPESLKTKHIKVNFISS